MDAIFTKTRTDRLTYEMKCYDDYGYQYWPIFKKTTTNFIGCCGVHPYDLDKRIVELGFHLLESAWGKGYAKEAAEAVINQMRGLNDVDKLFAGHHPGNIASKKLLEKLGFQFVSEEFYEPTGLYHPSYLLEL